MATTNRASLINKLYKAAKKKYEPIPPLSNRSVLEHSLYACCLENGTYEAADEAFALLDNKFFDWNEVRVTTTNEVAEVIKCLHRPMYGATSVRKTLHGIFETYYAFELDYLRKENLRKTVKQFEQMKGVTPFVVSYTAQVALGGHSIPLDSSMLLLMYVCGIITEAEAKKGKVPGLERTIAKNKGIEFTSVVHQLAADFFKSPFNKDLRAFLTKISPDAKDRFPKRGAKIKIDEPEPEAEPVEEEVKADSKGAKAAKAKAAANEKAAKEKAAKASKGKATEKTATKKAAKKTPVKKATTKKKAAAKKAPAKKATKKTTKKAAKKKPVKKKAAKTSKTKKKSPTKRLARKKPR